MLSVSQKCKILQRSQPLIYCHILAQVLPAITFFAMITRFCVSVWSSKLDWTCSALLQLVERSWLRPMNDLLLVSARISRFIIGCQIFIQILDTDLVTWLPPRTLNSFHLSILISMKSYSSTEIGVTFSTFTRKQKSTCFWIESLSKTKYLRLYLEDFGQSIFGTLIWNFDWANWTRVCQFYQHCCFTITATEENIVPIRHQYWTFQIKG